MSAVLLDTHALVWNLERPQALGAVARSAILAATEVLVCPISLYEIGQKVRFGKWSVAARMLPEIEATSSHAAASSRG